MNADEVQTGTLALYLRSFSFWIVFAVLILVFATLLLLSFPVPLNKRFRLIHYWTKLSIWWLRVTCNLRFEISGTENIPEQPAIVFSKHQSTWETIALNFWFSPQAWVIKRELLWVPVFGWGAYMMDPIALNRSAGKKAIRQLIEKGREKLDSGRWIIIFPEGTRTAPGRKGRYRIGGAVLAEQSGYPVVPVAHNAGEYWPRRKFIKRPGVIRIQVGPLIETRGRTAQEILTQAEQWIESEMAKITVLEHHQYGVDQKEP